MDKPGNEEADKIYELWRQDDNGHKFLIEKFSSEADALKAMKEFEARLHKQTYWIEDAQSSFEAECLSKPI